MQRNTLLAVVLSVSILFIYEMVFVAPMRAKALKEKKAVGAEVVTEKTTGQTIEPLKSIESSTKAIKKGTESELLTKSFRISSSDVGGSLHKIKFPSGKHSLPLVDILSIEGYENADFETVSATPEQAVYVYKTSSLEIKKTYEANDNKITLRVDVLSQDQVGEPDLKFKAYEVDLSSLETLTPREAMLDEYAAKVGGKTIRKSGLSKFEAKESKVIEGKADWIAFREHYNALAIKPEFETKTVEFKQVTDKKFAVLLQPKQPQARYDFVVYVGPQNKALIANTDKTFSDVVAFSGFYVLEIIAQATYHVMIWIHQIIKSWGISIILMSILIYGMTYPLTIKSMMSMRKMQAVQPKMAALKERFKNDPQKLNLEIVELYKKEKINPFGGCLPMLIQMPFFMAIYQVLWRSYYFQGESFLWIRDLSQPDRLFTLPFSLPFLGNDFNILPILMGIVMFWQQKLTAKSTVVTDETQAMQQKMMTIVFPFMIGFIFYKFASSLSLYFTMFYLFSALTQWKMSKVK